jgi:hypothetical protein
MFSYFIACIFGIFTMLSLLVAIKTNDPTLIIAYGGCSGIFLCTTMVAANAVFYEVLNFITYNEVKKQSKRG